MIRAIAIDDEPLALEIIKRHAARFEKIELAACFLNPAEAYPFLEGADVSLIFLDIDLKQYSGIDVAETLKGRYSIIFTTAYAEFAVKGFEVDAVDYLLKPISYSRFEEACNKFLLRHAHSTKTKTIIKEGNTVHSLVLSDILFLEAAGNYIKIHFRNNTIVARITIKDMLSRLGPDQFIRTHKSFVVNRSLITRIVPGAVYINDVKIPLSARYKDEMQKIFQPPL